MPAARYAHPHPQLQERTPTAGADCVARSSHGSAFRRSKVSTASASIGRALTSRRFATSHSACSSCVTASQKGIPSWVKASSAATKDGSTASGSRRLSASRARNRSAWARRYGGRTPGPRASTTPSSSSTFVRSLRARADSHATRNPALTFWCPAPPSSRATLMASSASARASASRP